MKVRIRVVEVRVRIRVRVRVRVVEVRVRVGEVVKVTARFRQLGFMVSGDRGLGLQLYNPTRL